VIGRAREILANLEKEELDMGGSPRLSRRSKGTKSVKQQPVQAELFGYPGDELIKELEQVDMNALTPIAALNLLDELKKKYLGSR
jgi:DNA mismatch repair protein MutS